MSTRSPRDAVTFWLASVLFFLSGGTGLAYQVIWFKRFAHVWGSSNMAMAAVVASFLTGLGLGAHLVGRFADRSRRCLLWYGVAEAAIGVIAALIPFALQALTAVSAALHPHLSGLPLVHTLARFTLTFLVLGPPCVLMGGTLPLLIRRFTPPGSALRDATGWLYAINTLGAAAGCYIAGFHLLPSFGLFATNLGVAALNLAIGGAAALASAAVEAGPAPQAPPQTPPQIPAKAPAQTPMQAPTPAQAPAPATPKPAGKEPRRAATPSDEPGRRHLLRLHAAVLLTGAASLILEMAWTRQLSVLLGGSTYAFTAMLFTLLLGIGAGSLIFHAWLRRARSMVWVPAITILIIAFTTVAGRLLIPQLTVLVGTIKDLRASQGWNAAVAVGASAALELVPAIGMGVLFPVCVDLTRRRAEEAGRAIGAVYAWNTAGSLLGSIGTTLLLIPLLGLGGTMALSISVYAAAMLLLTTVPLRGRALASVAALLVAMLHLAPLAAIRFDPLRTDLGMYMYGNITHLIPKYAVESFEEGSSANVLVTRQGSENSLRVNGKVDASTGHDMAMQLGLAYLPLFLAPDARELCVIGFGSGTTAGAALLFPETRVTCLEIEPAVFRASKFFAEANHRPQDRGERFKIVFDDGRSHVQGASARYDLILSEPSNPWIAGVSNLFTQEFYEAARARLGPGGMLAQWIQTYSFSAAEYALVAQTVLKVFPHCGLVRISVGDTILLASSEPIVSSKERIDRAQAIVAGVPALAADLKKHFETTDVRSILLQRYLMDTQAVRSFIAAQNVSAVNTDHNLRLEFDAPLRLFEPDAAARAVMGQILKHTRGEWFREAATAWGATKEHAPLLRTPLTLLDPVAQRGVLKEVTGFALSLDPENPSLLVDELVIEPPTDPAVFGAAIDRILALSRKEANRLGVTFFKGQQLERAVTVFNRVLAQHPQSTTTWNNLAIAYEALGKTAEARTAFEKAIGLDPVHEQARKSFEAFQLKHSGGQAAAETAPPAEGLEEATGDLPEDGGP